MLSLIFTLLLLLFGSCGARFAVTSPVPEPEPALSPSVAIFTPDQSDAVSYLLPQDAENYWQIQTTDILQLETDLEAYLRNTPAYQGLDPFDGTYQRQYFGYERAGQRYIYGNFFCDDFGADWREVWIDVDDGGDCYFSFSYRLANRAFENFYVNGEA